MKCAGRPPAPQPQPGLLLRHRGGLQEGLHQPALGACPNFQGCRGPRSGTHRPRYPHAAAATPTPGAAPFALPEGGPRLAAGEGTGRPFRASFPGTHSPPPPSHPPRTLGAPDARATRARTHTHPPASRSPHSQNGAAPSRNLLRAQASQDRARDPAGVWGGASRSPPRVRPRPADLSPPAVTSREQS